MFTAKWETGKSDAALELQKNVFVEELENDIQSIVDGNVPYSMYLLVKEGDDTVATGRLYPSSEGCIIDGVCVRSDKRNKRYGDLCMRMLLFKAASLTAPIVMHGVNEAQLKYFSRFGFKKTIQTGELFTITVAPEDVKLSDACARET